MPEGSCPTWNTRLRMPETLSRYWFMAIFIHSTL
jgi:hypothetical protein